MNQETEKVIREYRFTVLVMGAVITFCMVGLAYILLSYVPDITYKITVQAMNKVFDQRAELTP